MTRPAAAAPAGVLRTAERPGTGALHRHGAWSAEDAWLIHGITGRAGDMSLFGAAPAGAVLPRWIALRAELGCTTIVHSRQVHGAEVLVHEALPAGVVIGQDADGHATAHPATLLAVSVADCVPIFIAAPDVRAVALLHGGWRGVAAGVLERGIAALGVSFGARADRLRVHLGPAICGECYEVGPEVTSGLAVPAATHVDLRAVLADRAVACGVPVDRISTSAHCTRCGDSPFFSHRAGCAERQIAVLGVRAP